MTKSTFAVLAFLAAFGGATTASAQVFADDSTLRSEQLFPYDDQEPWKHGYIQVMPFYGGYHYFRPYNYKHVYAQSAQASRWGMPRQAPYSQQFWHQYENRTDLSIAQSMTEAAPMSHPVSPAAFQHAPAPVPAMTVDPALASDYAEQTAAPLPAPMLPPVQGAFPQGYQASPQYSNQLWGQPAAQ